MTFHEKERRDHIGRMRSRRMRLPGLGARGSIRAAGVSRKVAAAAANVASSVTPTPMAIDVAVIAGRIGSGNGISGTQYMIA